MKWDINSYIFYIQEIKEKKKLRSTLKFCTQKLVTLDGDDICVYMEWGEGLETINRNLNAPSPILYTINGCV